VLDNLSRKGSENNLAWLRENHPDLPFLQLDIRDAAALNTAVAQTQPDVVLHLAAQVAVTTSVTNPRHDFEVNALGSFNVLEAVRQSSSDAILLYASTNKVYGGCEFAPLLEKQFGRPIPVGRGDWRPGDQKVYVSNIAKAGRDFGWQPTISVEEGVARLVEWVSRNPHLFEQF
jgi:CDP-paratose 2-epimerase